MSFGAAGLASADFGAVDIATAMARQPDGRIVLAGIAESARKHDFALARWLADGFMDADFGRAGIAAFNIEQRDDFAAAVVASDESVVVAGQTCEPGCDLALVGLDAQGRPDRTFGDRGVVIVDVDQHDQASSLLAQPDGKLLVAGTAMGRSHYDPVVARFHSDGRLDRRFGRGGIARIEYPGFPRIVAAVLQTDGKVVLIASTLVLFRLDSAGRLDQSFGARGVVALGVAAQAAAATVDPAGNIVMVGAATVNGRSGFAVLRLRPDGTLDPTFGGG